MEGAYGEGAIKVKVAAPPVVDRANDEVERFLAGVLGVSRSRVEVVDALASRIA